MTAKRSLTKTGAELQDIVELLDQTTGEFFIPFSDFVVTAGSPSVENSGGGTNTAGYAMDDTSEESVSAVVRVPNSLPALDFTEQIEMYFQWSAAATSGDVIWDLTVVPVALGESLNSSATASQVTDTVAGTTWLLSETPVFSVAANLLSSSDLFFFKATRKAAEGGDNMTGDAHFHGVRIAYTTNPNIV